MSYTPYQFANDAVSTVGGGAGGLGSPLSSGDTTLHLPTGDGALFPSSGFFMLRIGTTENVKVTLRVTDTLTIVRGQEGTSADTWPIGTTVQLIVSAQALNDGMLEIATLDSSKASLSGAAFTGNVSTTGTLGVTGLLTAAGGASLNGAAVTGTLTTGTDVAVGGVLGVTGVTNHFSTIAKYNNENTAGLGIPYTKASVLEQHVTATGLSTIITYTVGAADEHLRAGFSLTLNNGTSGQAVLAALTYTNRNGVNAGHRFSSVASGGTTVIVLDGSTSRTNSEYPCQPFDFVAQATTSVTITYNSGTNTPNDYVTASIERLA